MHQAFAGIDNFFGLHGMPISSNLGSKNKKGILKNRLQVSIVCDSCMKCRQKFRQYIRLRCHLSHFENYFRVSEGTENFLGKEKAVDNFLEGGNTKKNAAVTYFWSYDERN